MENQVSLDQLRRDLEIMLENYKIWKSMLDINDPMYDFLWDSSMGNLGMSVFNGGNGDYVGNKVVKYVGNLEELKVKVSFIESLISGLDREAIRFVEKRYFQRAKREEVIAELFITDSSYKRIRRRVLDQFLFVLGIIPPENDPKMARIWPLQTKNKCYSGNREKRVE